MGGALGFVERFQQKQWHHVIWFKTTLIWNLCFQHVQFSGASKNLFQDISGSFGLNSLMDFFFLFFCTLAWAANFPGESIWNCHIASINGDALQGMAILKQPIFVCQHQPYTDMWFRYGARFLLGSRCQTYHPRLGNGSRKMTHTVSRWWFQRFFIFTPIHGEYFSDGWVETTSSGKVARWILRSI